MKKKTKVKSKSKKRLSAKHFDRINWKTKKTAWRKRQTSKKGKKKDHSHTEINVNPHAIPFQAGPAPPPPDVYGFHRAAQEIGEAIQGLRRDAQEYHRNFYQNEARIPQLENDANIREGVSLQQDELFQQASGNSGRQLARVRDHYSSIVPEISSINARPSMMSSLRADDSPQYLDSFPKTPDMRNVTQRNRRARTPPPSQEISDDNDPLFNGLHVHFNRAMTDLDEFILGGSRNTTANSSEVDRVMSDNSDVDQYISGIRQHQREKKGKLIRGIRDELDGLMDYFGIEEDRIHNDNPGVSGFRPMDFS